MSCRILCVLLLLLSSSASGLPLGPVEAVASSNESAESFAGALDPVLPRGLTPRPPEPGGAVGTIELGLVRPQPPRGIGFINSPTPLHVRLCVWRE